MDAVTAIGMVSESLRNLLVGEMTLTPPVDVTILAPDETGGDRRINLFLYRIEENTTLKNAAWQVKAGQPTQLAPPPLSVNLFYLMTPYALNDVSMGNISAHDILGEAMRVLHEQPIVPQAYLVDGLKEAREQIKIMLHPFDVEELGRVWSTFAQPFRLSVMYEVAVAQMEMLAERTLAKRVTTVRVPEIRAPFHPPVVEALTPLHGPAGTVVTVQGQHLAGWRSVVTVMGQAIASQDLSSDAFQVPLPETLPLGHHAIRIDIGHLHRRVFFFEVGN